MFKIPCRLEDHAIHLASKELLWGHIHNYVCKRHMVHIYYYTAVHIILYYFCFHAIPMDRELPPYLMLTAYRPYHCKCIIFLAMSSNDPCLLEIFFILCYFFLCRLNVCLYIPNKSTIQVEYMNKKKEIP